MVRTEKLAGIFTCFCSCYSAFHLMFVQVNHLKYICCLLLSGVMLL